MAIEKKGLGTEDNPDIMVGGSEIEVFPDPSRQDQIREAAELQRCMDRGAYARAFLGVLVDRRHLRGPREGIGRRSKRAHHKCPPARVPLL